MQGPVKGEAGSIWGPGPRGLHSCAAVRAQGQTRPRQPDSWGTGCFPRGA